jgi:hypothetical protein
VSEKKKKPDLKEVLLSSADLEKDRKKKKVEK